MSEKDALECKVVLLGESGVGKTSIIDRYVENTFSSSFVSSPSAKYSGKYLHFKEYEKFIKFELWDYPGTKKYRSLAKVFFSTAKACILVYDITRKQSFEELKNFWIKEIKANSPSEKSNQYFFNINIYYSICNYWKQK